MVHWIQVPKVFRIRSLRHNPSLQNVEHHQIVVFSIIIFFIIINYYIFLLLLLTVDTLCCIYIHRENMTGQYRTQSITDRHLWQEMTSFRPLTLLFSLRMRYIIYIYFSFFTFGLVIIFNTFCHVLPIENF